MVQSDNAIQPHRQTLLYSATVPAAMQQIAKKALRPGDQQRFVDCIGDGGGETAAKLEQFHVAACVGLVRIVALYYRSSTSHHIR